MTLTSFVCGVELNNIIKYRSARSPKRKTLNDEKVKQLRFASFIAHIFYSAQKYNI